MKLSCEFRGLVSLEFDGFSDKRKLIAWDRLNDQLAPVVGAFMILAQLRDGKRQLTFQCLECDALEKPHSAVGWLKGELQA